MTREEVAAYFDEEMGCEETIVLTRYNDYATGHIDMHCTFAAADLLIVALYDEETDSVNRQIQLENLELLRTYNESFDVTVLQMPTNCRVNSSGVAPSACPDLPLYDRIWRSYTNLFHVGDTIVMPKYSDIVDDEAIAQTNIDVLEEATNKTVVRVDTTELIKYQGSIHCITSSIPQAFQ